jgi:hypothetical protein
MSEVIGGTDVQINYHAAGADDGGELNAVLDTITGGGDVNVWKTDTTTLAVAAITAFVHGDCDLLLTMVAPGSSLDADCSSLATDERIDGALDALPTRPTIEPNDLTHDAVDVTTRDAGLASGWYVEMQGVYDTVTPGACRLIVQLTEPSGTPIISPSATSTDGGACPNEIAAAAATNSSVVAVTNSSVPPAAG